MTSSAALEPGWYDWPNSPIIPSVRQFLHLINADVIEDSTAFPARLGIRRDAKSYRAAKACEDRLFEHGGLIAEAEVVSGFLPCFWVGAILHLDGSDATAQEKRVLVRQDVARRSDLVTKREPLAQAM